MPRSDVSLISAGALCALGLLLSGGSLAAGETSPRPAQKESKDAKAFPALAALEREVSLLVARARPSVVAIVSKTSIEQMLTGLGERLIIDPSTLAHAEALASRVGSGVILDALGNIATVASVVDGTNELSVILSDGTRLLGRLRGIDDYSGLAVISVKTDRLLQPATVAVGSAMKPGALVAAFSGSADMGSTYSLGFLSGRGISSGPMRRGPYLKLDAFAAPGSSGGPVFDSRGSLVGLLFGGATSGLAQSATDQHGAIRWHMRTPSPRVRSRSHADDESDAQGEDEEDAATAAPPIPDEDVWHLRSLHREGTMGGGVSYAVPIEVVQSVTDQIIASGSVARGWLGVSVESSDEGEVLVTRVTPGSPAFAAGMRVGDFIVSLDGSAVNEAERLVERIAGAPPGETLSLVIERQGEPLAMKVTLARRPEGREGLPRQPFNLAFTPPQPPPPRMGVTLETPDEAERGRIGAPSDSGLIIRDVRKDSAAERGAVEEGDLLTHVMGEAIRSLEELRRILRRHDPGKEIAIKLIRDHQPLDLVLPAPDPADQPEPPTAPSAPRSPKPRSRMKAPAPTP